MNLKKTALTILWVVSVSVGSVAIAQNAVLDAAAVQAASDTETSVRYTDGGVDRLAVKREACRSKRSLYSKGKANHFKTGIPSVSVLTTRRTAAVTACTAEASLRNSMRSARESRVTLEQNFECDYVGCDGGS